jgi:mannose-6-phosphate isomerase-like protein (cupin superfamily)
MKNDLDIVSIKNAEHYLWGTNCDGWHLVNKEELSVIQERVPPGASEIKHYHNKSRQFFYILKGRASIEFDDKTIILNQDEGIEIPPNITHKLFNSDDVDLIFLVISQPKSHGDKILVEE